MPVAYLRNKKLVASKSKYKETVSFVLWHAWFFLQISIVITFSCESILQTICS